MSPITHELFERLLLHHLTHERESGQLLADCDEQECVETRQEIVQVFDAAAGRASRTARQKAREGATDGARRRKAA